MSFSDALELTPGALAVCRERKLACGWTVEFQFAPAGWLAKSGRPRQRDWRAYCLTRHETERPMRVESVTTICDRILPKDGLPIWSERAGIRGTVEALKRGLIGDSVSHDDAVEIVRQHKLGADAARDESADRGLNVHSILEHYAISGEPPNPREHPLEHRPFIRGLVRWLLHASPEPLDVEMLVADPVRRYAGRLDLLAEIRGRPTLVDLKTQERGSIYESAHIQTRLYWEAEERYGDRPIERALIVVVNGRGEFREMPLLADEMLARHALDFYAQIKPVCAACDQENRIARQTSSEEGAS